MYNSEFLHFYINKIWPKLTVYTCTASWWIALYSTYYFLNSNRIFEIAQKNSLWFATVIHFFQQHCKRSQIFQQNKFLKCYKGNNLFQQVEYANCRSTITSLRSRTIGYLLVEISFYVSSGVAVAISCVHIDWNDSGESQQSAPRALLFGSYLSSQPCLRFKIEYLPW